MPVELTRDISAHHLPCANRLELFTAVSSALEPPQFAYKLIQVRLNLVLIAAMEISPQVWQENIISQPTKRKRSPVDATQSIPLPKVPKTQGHLQINYLARQYSDTIPLITSDDNLPSLLSLIGDYDGVLQRHESMAGNLGARPLGPILIKRFERLFDGPPRVLKSHGKEGTTIGWLDVVEFARNKPEQFNLEKMRDGVRVCQFYTRQCRVEITEEDFLLIASGMPQKLIPPQPILEDEEKELGTLEILEKNLTHIVQLADQGDSLSPLPSLQTPILKCGQSRLGRGS